MRIFNLVTIMSILVLVGVELSVTVFVNPVARQLTLVPQQVFLSRLARVLGNVMQVWYPFCGLLLGIQAWVYRHAMGHEVIFTAAAMWLLASLGSLLFLVPMNNRLAEGAPNWQHIHTTWDKRHRIRTAILALAAALFSYTKLQ